MTTIDTAKLARGWGLIAEGAMEISLAYEQPAGGAVPPPSAPAPVDDLPPLPPLEEPPVPAPMGVREQREVIADTALGLCPTHNKPWTVKAAGVSKAGQPFPAFWRCNERDASGFCKKRPLPVWSGSHPIQEGEAA